MQSVVRLLCVSAASAGLLAGCGGGFSLVIGDDGHDHDPFWDPFFSGRATSLTVDGSDDRLDGTWSASNTELTQVLRFSGDPPTCRFQFYGVRMEGDGPFMDGEIRYVLDLAVPRTVFIGIGPREYRLDGGTWRIARDTDRIVFDATVLQSMQVSGETLTLTGSLPLPRERPAGC